LFYIKTVNKFPLSLSDEIILLLSEKPLDGSKIREMLDLFETRDRKVVWATLDRLVRNKLVKKDKRYGQVIFSLTKAGVEAIPKEPSFIPIPERAWDQKWRVVIFDIPEKARNVRNHFIARLKELGFARLQNSVYLTVHNVCDQVKETAQLMKILPQVKMMVVEKLFIDDWHDFAAKLWDLKNLASRYKGFLERYQNGYHHQKTNPEILKHWLKRARYEYLSILHDDPVLPKELLPPDWEGGKARELWMRLESILETYE